MLPDKIEVTPAPAFKEQTETIHLDNTLHSAPVPLEIERKIKRDLIAAGVGMGGAIRWLNGEDIGKY